MSEERFHNYRRPVDSFAENRRVLGIIEPGIYRGFDVFTPGVGLAFTLSHGAKGIVQTNANNTTQTPAKGVLVTRHGGVVQEDAALALTLTTNASNTEDRYDLIIYEHQWLASVGGQSGIYSIVQGPNADPSIPAITNPKIQIALGYIKIPAGSSLASDCTWVRYRERGLGGTNVALLDEANIFSGLNSHDFATGTIVNYSGVSGFNAIEWDMTKNNVYIANIVGAPIIEALPNAPVGTRVTIGYYGDNIQFRQGALTRMITAGIAQTHGPINISGDGVVSGLKIPLATNLAGKYGLRYIEFIARPATSTFLNCSWEVISLPERTLELSEAPYAIQSGDWTNLTTLNTGNSGRLDVGTTLEDLVVKYVGKHLYLQGKATIKIVSSALGAFHLVYPKSTTKAAVDLGSTTPWIIKKIMIQNVTDSTVVEGYLIINQDFIEMSLASGSFQVGKIYNIHLMEQILLKEV